VVFGVGNCTFNNLGEAIIGVNLSDGQQRFRYAPREPMDPTAGDPDVDFGATPNLLPGGLVGEGGKDGHYYALDPDTIGATGEPAWNANAAMNSDLGGMIGSTAVGQARGGPAVFASSGIPVNTREEYTFSSISQAIEQIAEGGSNATVRIPPGGIHAIDATTGKVLWDAPAPPAYGGVVHVNGVVFLPATFGFSIQAYHADTGALLWEYPLVSTTGPLAPASPVTTVGNSIFFGAGMLLADPNAGGVWAMSLPALPSIG
jgi:outer membrane protein assembly factor BamB